MTTVPLQRLGDVPVITKAHDTSPSKLLQRRRHPGLGEHHAPLTVPGFLPLSDRPSITKNGPPAPAGAKMRPFGVWKRISHRTIMANPEGSPCRKVLPRAALG